jgi:hypothetical protein
MKMNKSESDGIVDGIYKEECKRFEKERLTNLTPINPIDQHVLKYHDCSHEMRKFLKETEGYTCEKRLEILNGSRVLFRYEEEIEDLDNFIEAYQRAKADVENTKQVDLSQSLKDLKKSPERMAALKKAIEERVYPPEIADPLLLNPLYKSVTHPDFVSEFEFNGAIAKAVIHYRREGAGYDSLDEIKESFKNNKKEEK